MVTPVLAPPLTRPRPAGEMGRTVPTQPGWGRLRGRSRPGRPGRPVLGAPAPAVVPEDTTPDATSPGADAAARARTTRRRRVRRAVALTAGIAAAVGLTLPAAVAADVVLAASEDERVPTDAIVVLGAGQFGGGDPAVLRARLEHARTLQREGVAPVIVTVLPRDEAVRAAGSRDWLVSHGSPESSVLNVASGSDTTSSVRAVARVLSDLGWGSVTVVSDPAHVARAASVAGAFGLDAHVSPTRTDAGSGLTAEYVARETAALLRFHLVSRWRTG